MKKRYVALIAVVALGVGVGIGVTQAPTKIQEVEKVVEKKNVVTIVKETKKPDGTIEKKTTIKDKSSTVKDTAKLIENKRADWKASGLVGISTKGEQVYGISIDRRILGNVFVGVWGHTGATAGISVGMEF